MEQKLKNVIVFSQYGYPVYQTKTGTARQLIGALIVDLPAGTRGNPTPHFNPNLTYKIVANDGRYLRTDMHYLRTIPGGVEFGSATGIPPA